MLLSGGFYPRKGIERQLHWRVIYGLIYDVLHTPMTLYIYALEPLQRVREWERLEISRVD